MFHTLLRRLIFSIFFLLSTDTFAQIALGPMSAPPTPDERRAIADDWGSLFKKLDQQIPTLSPTQQRWLKAEYHDQIEQAGNRYNERALTARASIEYQIFIVKPRTTKIISLFNQISSGEFRDRNQEIALWSSAVSMLVDYEYWQAINNLVDRGTIKSNVGHINEYYFENYVFQAQIFLLTIITPYLEDRLP